MENKMRMILALLFAVMLIPAAHAQKTGPNGGLVVGKGGHETELVVTPTELTVYIIDHGKVHSTKGVNLRAIIQQGGKSTTVPLVDVGGTKLTGELKVPIAPGAIVVITGKDDHGDVLSARYTIK
jgi:hypothetical protein